LARPPPSFSSPAAAHLLPPFPARRLPLTDRWAHPDSEPGRLPPPARAATAHPVGCRRSARRRPSPSHTRMELDRTATWPPSLSRTSSAPHRPPPRINVETDEFKTHRRRPPPTPHLASHDPIKGTAHHPLLPHNPLPHFSSVLSVPSFVSARRSRRRFASPLSATLCYRAGP
jgi:hypothetical protein